jgi:hypothetical protein
MSTKHIAVDFAAPAPPPFSFAFGVNHGPQCDCAGHVSVAAELQRIGASVIRTHDSGVLDWPLYFPHSLSLAEPNATTPRTDDPANYNWAAADEYYANIVDSGFSPYFRLGTSWGQKGGGLPPAGTPYNRTALVDVLLHTVMHFNAGWGTHPGGRDFGGRNASSRTLYWEIWNEPDSAALPASSASFGRFWNRTAADLYLLVHETATAIKAFDPTLRVGADGCSGYGMLTPGDASAYSFGMIDYLGSRQTPVDFFSWHEYTEATDLYTSIAEAVRDRLDHAGMAHVAQHVTEWFPCILCKDQDNARGAAALGSTLVRMVDAGVALVALYPLCSSDEGRLDGHGWGLFDGQSVPGTALWRPLTHVLASFGELISSCPLGLPATASPPASTVVDNSSSDTTNTTDTITVLAGRSGDGAPRSLKLLLASPGLCPRVYSPSGCTPSAFTTINLTVSGLGISNGGLNGRLNRGISGAPAPAPAASEWRYSVALTNESATEHIVLGGIVSPNQRGEVTLSFEARSPAVAFVRMSLVADEEQSPMTNDQ